MDRRDGEVACKVFPDGPPDDFGVDESSDICYANIMSSCWLPGLLTIAILLLARPGKGAPRLIRQALDAFLNTSSLNPITSYSQRMSCGAIPLTCSPLCDT